MLVVHRKINFISVQKYYSFIQFRCDQYFGCDYSINLLGEKYCKRFEKLTLQRSSISCQRVSNIMAADSQSPWHTFPVFGNSDAITGLLLMANTLSTTNGIFSRFTMTSMTSGWYLAATPFEVIFIGLVVLQIYVFRYLQILPLSLTDYFHTGVLFGKRRKRRKRRQIGKSAHNFDQIKRESEAMFTILRKLDKQDCLLSSVCLLESLKHSNKQTQRDLQNKTPLLYESFPKQIKWVLTALRKSAQKRKRYQAFNTNNVTIEDRPVIAVFEEAVEYGGKEFVSAKMRPIISCNNSSLIQHHVNPNNSTFDLQRVSANLHDDDVSDEQILMNSNIFNNDNAHDQGDQNHFRTTICQRRYSLCPLSITDTLHHLETVLRFFNAIM